VYLVKYRDNFTVNLLQLSNGYKILSTVLPSRLTSYVVKIIGDYKCVFRRNRKTTDKTFFFRQMLKKMEV